MPTTAKLSVADQEYQRQVKKLIHQLEFRIAKAKRERTNADIASDAKPDDAKALAKVDRVELKLSDLHGELALAKSQLL